MQRIGAVIGGQLKALAIQFERAARDPVGVAPDRGAEEAPNREIACKIIAAEDHIGKAPGPVRREDRLQRRAIGDEAHLETVVAAQPHQLRSRCRPEDARKSRE